jgi:hypothetical protein
MFTIETLLRGTGGRNGSAGIELDALVASRIAQGWSRFHGLRCIALQRGRSCGSHVLKLRRGSLEFSAPVH